jgi:hypothetical protein
MSVGVFVIVGKIISSIIVDEGEIERKKKARAA